MLFRRQPLKVNVSSDVVGSISSSLLSLTKQSRIMTVLPGKEALESIGMNGSTATGLWLLCDITVLNAKHKVKEVPIIVPVSESVAPDAPLEEAVVPSNGS